MADCLGAISIPQQPEKKKKGNTLLDRQAGGLVYSLYASFYHLKNDAALLVHSSTQTHNDEFSALFSPSNSTE